jgi:hypothetical protein
VHPRKGSSRPSIDAGDAGVRADPRLRHRHQYLGLYVASFLLVAGFMWWIGRIALWKSLLTSFLFTAAMFLTFEIRST